MQIITRLENFINSYIVWREGSAYSLPVALWIAATYCHMGFDSFPYMVITSATSESGKTRLLELIFFTAFNPIHAANVTKSALFRSVDSNFPTLLIDEAEQLSAEAADLRPLINAGYRRGATVMLTEGRRAKKYRVYCPKAFALIGDVYLTLRSRSMEIIMARAERAPAKKFLYGQAQSEGEELRTELKRLLSSNGELREKVEDAFRNFGGLTRLSDRNEEIFTPLFVMCEIFCPERIEELTKAVHDMAAEKTSEARRHNELREEETKRQDSAYARLLLSDLHETLSRVEVAPNRRTVGQALPLTEAIERLKAIPDSPWRKYKGIGLEPTEATRLLGLFKGQGRGGKLETKTIRFANEPARRGFDLKQIEAACRANLIDWKPKTSSGNQVVFKDDGFCYCPTGQSPKHKPGSRGCHFKNLEEMQRELYE